MLVELRHRELGLVGLVRRRTELLGLRVDRVQLRRMVRDLVVVGAPVYLRELHPTPTSSTCECFDGDERALCLTLVDS